MKKEPNIEEKQKKLEELVILKKQEEENIKTLKKKLELVLQEDTSSKKKKAMINKLKRSLFILMTAGISYLGLKEVENRDIKNKRNYENREPEKEIIKKIQEDFVSLEKIEKAIPQELLDFGIQYEDIAFATYNIKDQETRNTITEFLYTGDIIGLQTFLGMKQNSLYADNNATGRIDRNTMELLECPYIGQYGKEILDNPNIGEDIKVAYEYFFNGSIDYNNQNYLLISKDSCTTYLFDKNNKLMSIQNTLIGGDIGQTGEFMPYEYYFDENGQQIYHRNDINTDTPEGYFMAWMHRPLNANDYYINMTNNQQNISKSPEAIIIMPIQIQTKQYDPRFDGTKYKLGIHPIFKPKENKEKYKEAINSKTIKDNTCTHGCLNNKKYGILYDNIVCNTKKGSIIYICRYHKKNPTVRKP